MAENINDSSILEFFKDAEEFTKDELKTFINLSGRSLSDNALRKRIYRLRRKDLIRVVKRGVYAINDKYAFVPTSDRFIKRINKLFHQQYNDINYCIWNTQWLHSFMNHQLVNSFYVLEVEKEFIDSVFYHFKDNGIKVFNNPSEQMMEEHVLGEQNVLIIKPFISRSPVAMVDKIPFARLEKILVDIYCDPHQFFIFMGQEMINIYENAFKHYNINIGSLHNYAMRRGKKKQIEEFIQNNILQND
jgi:hypothetical protein